MDTIIFVTVAIVLLIWFKLKLPFLVGRVGENFVTDKLQRLDPTHYKILNDLLLPSKGSLNTTQIDHVVVSNFGIFCIETKAYSGWIFGNAYQKYWTQVIYRYKKRFYNPLRQNYAHTKAVEALVKPLYSNILIMSFIAFPNADKLKISGTDSVGCAKDVLDKIVSFNKQIISDSDRDKIYGILMNANIQDEGKRASHNEGVRDIK
jgi:hypothetical protein